MHQQHGIDTLELTTTSGDQGSLEALLGLDTPSVQGQDFSDKAFLQPHIAYTQTLNSATFQQQPASEEARDARHKPSRARRSRNKEVNRRHQRDYRNRQKVTTTNELLGCAC